MGRISDATERKIFETYFKGYARDKGARIAHVSGETYSRKAELLPDSVKELRALSVELRKYKASLPEALKGAKLLAKLSRMDLNLEELNKYIKTVKAASQKIGYEPKQLVEAALELDQLERESGKQYAEAITQFKAKELEARKLEITIVNLEQKAENTNRLLKQRLKKNRVTNKQIIYINTLRIELRNYGIKLEDAKDLLKFLKAMQETRYNPRNFVKKIRKLGSLKGAITQIEKQKQQEAQDLATLKNEIGNLETEKKNDKDELFRLKLKRMVLEDAIKKLEKEKNALENENENRKTENELETKKLAQILNVEAKVKEINDAIVAKNKILTNLYTKVDDEKRKLENVRSEIKAAIATKETLQHEIENVLNIKDYVTQLKDAIANLEKQKTMLETKIVENSDKIALADTIVNFLTRRSAYDFNRFYSLVETVRMARDDPNSPLRALIPRTEENIRMHALQAFDGDLVSKRQHDNLRKSKEDYRIACEERDKEINKLRSDLKESQDKALHLENTVEISNKIIVHAKEGDFALKELRRWLLDEIDKEIEMRANKKFDQQTARTYGVLEWITDEFKRRNQ